MFCIIAKCLYIERYQRQDLRRPEGQVHVVLIYAPWSRDRRGVGWMYTGPHSWWHAQQTNSGIIRPTANRFRAV